MRYSGIFSKTARHLRFSQLALFFLIACLTGCVRIISGVTSNSIYTNVMPGVIISTTPFLALQGYGSFMTGVSNDAMLDATAYMSYAMFSSTDSGLVEKHAHAVIARIQSPRLWRFELENQMAPNVLTMLNGAYGDNREWTTQLMFVPAKMDWISALWQANGRQTPALWLAKRWSSTPMDDTRYVAEYREPFPNCLPDGYDPDKATSSNPYAGVLDQLMEFGRITPACGDAIVAFEERADKAFTLARFDSSSTNMTTPPNKLTNIPDQPPHADRIFGKIEPILPGDPLRRW